MEKAKVQNIHELSELIISKEEKDKLDIDQVKKVLNSLSEIIFFQPHIMLMMFNHGKRKQKIKDLRF